MTGKVLQDNINTLDSRFNMRMFLADMPRVLNETFKVIKSALTKVYNAETDELQSTKVKTGTLQASTVIANNISFKGGDDSKTLRYEEVLEIKKLADSIKKMQDDIDKIKTQMNIN
jgi:hypothetical protein